MKKGLVVIYDPHALMQFLQFYCMGNHSEIEWDVLCLPKDDGKQEMDVFCEKSGVFQKIYANDTEFKSLPVLKKLALFIPMTLYALIGKRKRMCIKIFNSMVDDIEAYDYYAANTESGFMAGLLASFAKEKTTVYFEDGSADYMIVRKKNQSYYRTGSFVNFQCVFMSKLGYFGKGYTYFEPTKNCYKYASNPDELAYKNYKKIFRFDLNADEDRRYRMILSRIYPELRQVERLNPDCAIVFTMPLTNKNIYKDKYIQKYEDYINTHATEIYLKKHPRDSQEYTFSDNVQFHEIPQDIPAEVLFPYFNGKKCYMMEPDSLLINMSVFDLKINILYYDDYSKEERILFNNWKSRESFVSYCKRFIADKYRIIDL